MRENDISLFSFSFLENSAQTFYAPFFIFIYSCWRFSLRFDDDDGECIRSDISYCNNNNAIIV